MVTDASLSTANYDNLLVGWAALFLQTGVSFDGGNSFYTDTATRQYIIDTFGWTIVDGGLTADITPPDINSPKDLNYEVASTRNEIVWIDRFNQLMCFSIRYLIEFETS
ncbi:MAG: hypothetical protein HeimC2_21890 [Candidatus Heimdallarchaeota archaeon LC_2]|nr:MAG: hypothetical protein HeimC2_21890 [Candidatus Heimdallarchaeota archaeon LC_2]